MKFLLIVWLSLGFLAGCYHYTSVEIHLSDAATGQPMRNIKVRSGYPKFHRPFAPKPSQTATNNDGIAHLKICTNSKPPFAGIYFPGSGDVLDAPTPQLLLIISTHFSAASSHRMNISLLTWPEYQAKYGGSSLSEPSAADTPSSKR
ncbi:MAG TPA: hypothetical protein VGG19_04570 [Tepidisphaeraceae bacterium]